MLYTKAMAPYCAEAMVRASDGLLLSCSQSLQSLTGVVSELSRSFYNLIAPEDRQRIRQAFCSCDKLQTQFCHGCGSDGKAAEYTLILSPGEAPGTVRCILLDITDSGRLREEWLRINQWLSALLANLQGGLFHYQMTADGRYQTNFVSDGMLSVLGCTKAQFQERFEGDLFRAIAAEDLNQFFLGPDTPADLSSAFELRIITYTGESRWLSANRQVLKAPDGSLEAYVVVNDITEAHRARREFEDIANSVPGGVARIRLDPQLHALYMTEGFCQLSQRTLEEFWKDTGGEVVRVIHPDDLGSVYRTVEEQRKSAILSLELRIFRKDGSIGWIHCTARQIPGSDDVFQGVFTDITASKESQQEREHLLRERDELINMIPGGVLQLSEKDGQPKDFFASDGYYSLFGYTREEYHNVFGDSFLNAVYPPEQPRVRQLTQERFRTAGALFIQTRILHKDGRLRWLSVSGNCITEPSGEKVYRCIFTDITDSKQTEQELEYEKERYRLMLECMENVTYEYDIDLDRMIFYTRDPATGKQTPLVLEPYTSLMVQQGYVSPEYQDLVLRLLHGETTNDPQEILAQRPLQHNGVRYTWYELRNVAIRGEDGRVSRCIGVLRDIDDQKRETLRLRYRSERDSLTGLYNKAACFANINDYLEQEGANRTSALLMIDFDDFKAINDTFGHQYGDAILADMARGMRRLFRESDVVARMGGDEFLVFMKDLVDETIVQQKARALCNLFRELYQNAQVRVSGSVGIAISPRDGRSCEELLRKADLALYSIKKSGKNGFRFYTPEEGLAMQLGDLGTVKGQKEDSPLPAPPDSFLLLRAVILVLSQKDAGPFRQRVKTILELMGKHCAADRAFMLAHGGPQLDIRPWKAEWRAAGVTGEVEFLNNRTENEYIQQLDARGIISFSLNENQETENPSLAARMKSRGAITTIQTPIRQNGILLGTLGMDDCRSPRPWTKQQADILLTVADLLAFCLPYAEEEDKNERET